MHLKVQQFALSAALTLGLVYIVCSIFVALLPNFASQLMSWLTHVVGVDYREVTWSGFLGGLIQVLIYTYVVTAIFAWLHNRSVRG